MTRQQEQIPPMSKRRGRVVIGPGSRRGELSAFACTMAWEGWDHGRTINARTRGQAKHQYLSSVRDAGFFKAGDRDQIAKFTDVRCRYVGKPITPGEFFDLVKYRGLPDWVRCGTRVKTESGSGFIVGHNSSANLNVLFDADSEYPGQTLNVHPASCEFLKE